MALHSPGLLIISWICFVADNHSAGSQMRVERWGTALGHGASVGNATDSVAGALTINFPMKMTQVTTHTITLTNFTVVR